MARLWHTAMLAQWKPVFEYIPIKSQIDKILDEVSVQVSEANIEITVSMDFLCKKGYYKKRS